MTEIPDDIMKAANECVAQFRWNNDNRWHLFVARAIQAERERDGWQPIETAPKDGTAIWVGHTAGMMEPALYRRESSGFWINACTSLPVQWRPTHWQPLPPSPKPAAVSEGGEDE